MLAHAGGLGWDEVAVLVVPVVVLLLLSRQARKRADVDAEPPSTGLPSGGSGAEGIDGDGGESTSRTPDQG